MLYQRRWCYEEQEKKYLRDFTTTGPLTIQYLNECNAARRGFSCAATSTAKTQGEEARVNVIFYSRFK